MRDFNHSVGVLVKAYFDGTLVHGNCYACAVGNLIADGLGAKVVKPTDGVEPLYDFIWDNGEAYPGGGLPTINESGWGALFSTSPNEFNRSKRQSVDTKFLQSDRVIKQISATGYTWKELARIEHAFESIDRRKKDKMFNGLMAVVDVLADIHGVDLSAKEQAKSLFVKSTL